MKAKRILLLMPHFWDPLCPPMGITSLKSYIEERGHQVFIYDFNSDPEIFTMQYKYFDLGARQIPKWRKWNIRRNGVDCLSQHQTIYLYGRQREDYPDLVREVMDISLSGRLPDIDIGAFDALFVKLFGLVEKKLNSLMSSVQPDFVGCTLLNSSAPACGFILQKAKELKPDVTTILGGPGPQLGITIESGDLMTYFENRSFVDYLVIGEGEALLSAIVEGQFKPRRILSRKDLPPSDEKMSGKQFAETYPLPSFDGLDTSRYLMLSVASSRGCPYECSFCAETVFWKGFRSVKAEELADRILTLADRHKSSTFYICDSLSNHIITPLTLKLKEKNAGIKLDCYLRADEPVTSRRNVAGWREGGLFRARLGLESASPKILEAMVKMTNPERMGKSVVALAEESVHTSTLWMIGFPGETESDFQMTLDFVKEHHKHIYQTDPILFLYHPQGLSNSQGLGEAFGVQYRFSKALQEALKINSYILEKETGLPEKFDRIERFDALQDDLGIPNPYTVRELLYADTRWSNLGRSQLWNPSFRTR